MRTNHAQRGSAFVYVVGAVGIASMIAAGYLITVDNGRERSARADNAAGQEIDLEQRLLLIKQGVEQQAFASARVDPATEVLSLSTSPGLRATLRLQADGGPPGPVTLQSFADGVLVEQTLPLSAPGDPFAGARAGVQWLNLTAETDATGPPSARLPDKWVKEHPEIALRQIPVSEFTLYVAGGGSRLGGQTFDFNLGRVYARGDLEVVGSFASFYPLVSGGTVTVVDGAGLDFQPPGWAGPPIELSGGFSTGDPEFAAMARTELGSQVVTPQSIPVNVGVSPAVYGGQGAAVAANGKQVDLSAFEANCATHVTVTVAPALPAGAAGGRYLVNVTGMENLGWAAKPDAPTFVQSQPFAAAGHDGVTVLAFDYAALGPQAGPRSINIRIYNASGLDPNALVLVRGAERLAGALAIVSPHTLVISGDFNVQPVNGTVPAASLVTAQGVQTENDADAVWARETFGSAF
ncbi:MAG: hypothetical protein JO069_09080 [Verrucomicrobia bacterium]|nr:hypothetical protein [Verrucomicrobiota bacterium]